MLDGINVLNKKAETGLPSWVAIVFYTALAISIVVGIVWSFIETDSLYFFTSLLIGLIIGATVLFVGDTFFKEPTGEYTYQVTIDDSIEFKEFDDSYSIIKKEGEIYYIREK